MYIQALEAVENRIMVNIQKAKYLNQILVAICVTRLQSAVLSPERDSHKEKLSASDNDTSDPRYTQDFSMSEDTKHRLLA